MKILITGVTGFIGSELATYLISSGHDVYGLIRRTPKSIIENCHYLTMPDLATLDVTFDAVVNLAGENIAAKPWTKARKQQLFDSRVDVTKSLLATLKYAPHTLISMSAVGVYGTDPETVFEEDTPAIDCYTHRLCRAWEEAAQTASAHGTRVCIMRLGVVLGRGGALAKMKPAFLIGMGGPIGDGQQWFPWIHIKDVLRLIEFFLKQTHLVGVFNAVAPHPIRQRDFAAAYGHSLHRPSVMPLPRMVVKLLFQEMSVLLLEGQKVWPKATLNAGFNFEYPHLEQALIAL